MKSDEALHEVLDASLLGVCPPRRRREIEQEVDLILMRYAPEADRETLLEAAHAMDQPIGLPPAGRRRLRLWAAVLRERAARAQVP